MCIFQIYAPDSSYSESEIDLMYDQVQYLINNLPPSHKYIILGDWNAKVGDDSEVNWPIVVGKFGVRECNERGERLL